MSFSYVSSGIAIGGDDYISAIRFQIQDTDSNAPELQDEEITALYNQYASCITTAQRVIVTALDCAKALHTRYAKQASFSSGGTSVQLLERAKYWYSVIGSLSSKLLSLNYNGPIAYAARESQWIDHET